MSSYLAPSVANPIDIDAGIKYKYVIAQHGAQQITVDPETDFTISVINTGSPGAFEFTFTGTALTVPIYHTLTVNLQMPEGAQTLSVNLRVLPISGTQRIANIINGGQIAVAPNQSVSVQIASDVAATYTAENLPAGLTISAAGLITGNAPSSNSFNVITFVATIGSNSYRRYFVILVGDGGFGGSLPPFIGTTATSARISYDGDFTIAQVAGPPDFIIPFAADPKPYVYKLKYWQFFANFLEPELGEAGPLGGGYVGGSPGTFKSIGGGVVEYEREYATVPNTRSEWESFVYNYHLQFFTFGLPNYCTQASPLRVSSRVQFDYFQTDDPNSIDLPRCGQYLETCLGSVKLGDPPDANTPSGVEILAEDATFKIWKPGIYERQMRFVKWINQVDLIFNDA